jgi:ABC-type sugar transport system substrate-binding protein
MSTRRPKAAALSGVAALTLTVSSCGADEPAPAGNLGEVSSATPTLVFSPLSLSVPALTGLAEGLKGYAGGQDWEVVVQDPNFDPTKQVTDLQAVISSGKASAVWVIPVAADAVKPVIATAQSEKIPILVAGNPEELGYDGPQPGIAFDDIDYGAAGEAVGTSLATCINDELGGPAQVLFLKSQASQTGIEDIVEQSTAALSQDAPAARIVQELEVTDRAKAQTDILNALQGNPDIDAVMATNDEGALGAIGAFAAAGKKLPCVSEFGGNPEVLGLVESGEIYASVAIQFEAGLQQSFDALVAMQDDPTAEGPVLIVPQKVITAP